MTDRSSLLTPNTSHPTPHCSTTDDGRVTEEELRLLVVGARDSGGIETEEAKMVEGVLDLQDMKVIIILISL